jgi:hypothetical protein
MSISWGSTNLNIQDYRRIGGESFYREHELIPDPTLASTIPQTVLQAFGRSRIRVFIEGYASDSDASGFDADKNAATSRTLAIDFDNSFSDTMIITKFETKQRIGVDKTWYTMELIEV